MRTIPLVECWLCRKEGKLSMRLGLFGHQSRGPVQFQAHCENCQAAARVCRSVEEAAKDWNQMMSLRGAVNVDAIRGIVEEYWGGFEAKRRIALPDGALRSDRAAFSETVQTLAGELYELVLVRERLSSLLDEVALAVKGPAPPLTLWGWHDLPELVKQLREAAVAWKGDTHDQAGKSR